MQLIYFLGEFLPHIHPFWEQPMRSQKNLISSASKTRRFVACNQIPGLICLVLEKGWILSPGKMFSFHWALWTFLKSTLLHRSVQDFIRFTEKDLQNKFNWNANKGLWQDDKFPLFELTFSISIYFYFYRLICISKRHSIISVAALFEIRYFPNSLLYQWKVHLLGLESRSIQASEVVMREIV